MFWQLSEEQKRKRGIAAAKVGQQAAASEKNTEQQAVQHASEEGKSGAVNSSNTVLEHRESVKKQSFLENLKPSFKSKDSGASKPASEAQLPRAASSKGDRFWSNIIPSFIHRDAREEEPRASIEAV